MAGATSLALKSSSVTSVTNADGTITVSGTSTAAVVSRAATTGDVVIPAGSNVATLQSDSNVNSIIQSRLLYVIGPVPSGDTTGATDTAAINALAGPGVWLQLLSTGTGTPYYVTSLPNITPNQVITGCGEDTTIFHVGIGACITIRNPNATTVFAALQVVAQVGTGVTTIKVPPLTNIAINQIVTGPGLTPGTGGWYVSAYAPSATGLGTATIAATGTASGAPITGDTYSFSPPNVYQNNMIGKIGSFVIDGYFHLANISLASSAITATSITVPINSAVNISMSVTGPGLTGWWNVTGYVPSTGVVTIAGGGGSPSGGTYVFTGPSCGVECGDIYATSLVDIIVRNYSANVGYLTPPYFAVIGASSIGVTVTGVAPTVIHLDSSSTHDTSLPIPSIVVLATSNGLAYFTVNSVTGNFTLNVTPISGSGTITGGGSIAAGPGAVGNVTQNLVSGDAGFWFVNKIGWTERLTTQNIHTDNCNVGYVVDSYGGVQSHEFSNTDFNCRSYPNQIGYVYQNGVHVNKEVSLTGNFIQGVTNTGYAWWIGADGSGVFIGSTTSPASAVSIRTKFETDNGPGNVNHFSCFIGGAASILGLTMIWYASGGFQIGINAAGSVISGGGIFNVDSNTGHYGGALASFGTPMILAAGSNSSGTASVSSPTLGGSAGAGAQLTNKTQDANLYITITTAGTLSIQIGPSASVANTIVNNLAAAIGDCFTIHLPAGWYIAVFTGTTAVWTAKAVTT